MSTDEPVRLRYTGDQATTFTHHGIGEVEPGETFDAPASALLSLMRRADVEHEGECLAPPCRCGEEAKAETQPGSAATGKPKGGRRRQAPSTQDGQDGAGE